MPSTIFRTCQRKLLDERLPELDNARQAEQKLLESMRPLIQRLSWREFELLIDLLFSTSGWRRLGATGGLQETVDLELILPTTGERAFVQIKSKASPETFNDYRNRLKQTSIYTRMFFVWHTGDVGKVGVDEKIILIGPSRLPQMILDAGLYTWLYGKVC